MEGATESEREGQLFRSNRKFHPKQRIKPLILSKRRGNGFGLLIVVLSSDGSEINV